MEVTERDGRLECILEVRSLGVNCRVEGMSRFMDRQLLQMWRGAAWKRRENVLQTVGYACCRHDRCKVVTSESWKRRVIHAVQSQNQ